MIPKPETCGGCPLFEKPYGKSKGYVPASGSGHILVVAEAAGADEEYEGAPLVGKSGQTLWTELSRHNISKDSFTIHNVLSCRPPDNKLVKMPYEYGAVEHCSPNLDKTIYETKERAREAGKTFVIVTLGVSPFKRIQGLDSKKDAELLKKDYYAYPFWNTTYGAWVLNAPHPAYLLRGNTHLWPVVASVFERAVEISNNGLVIENGENYLLDPSVYPFQSWIEGYKLSLTVVPDNPLSYDIETPYKKKTDAEDELGKDEDSDHTILRISFSYWLNGRTYTVSVKWSAENMAGIEELFTVAPFVLGWNSDKYDYPRVSRYIRIRGVCLDGMVAWHILNSAMPKALGFVTPYFWKNTLMWKHLADSKPAFYNAKDADAALRCFMGTKNYLLENGLWAVYERHWIELNKALNYMSGEGVLLDAGARATAEEQLTRDLNSIEEKMEMVVPKEARKFKPYKKRPKDESKTLVEATKEYPAKYCEVCGEYRPTKSHKKRCETTTVVSLPLPQTIWLEPQEFKVSKVGLTSYQAALKHQAIVDRRAGKVTFDADAIVKLAKKYPRDPLYPLILDHRKVSKLLGTYIGYTLPNGKLHGGMPVGSDGRIHTVFGRNASTLRFTSEEPNLQNLPRPNPNDPDDIANIIRNLIVAGPGNTLYARDFSGIEAVLTGYFSLDPKYIRLAKQDIHTYYTVYALYELEGGARIKASDLPDIDWPDDRLFPYLAELKKSFKKERNNLYKHLVHAANFMQGAMGARDKIFSETGIEYPVATVKKVMDVYYTLFPKIRTWHKSVLDEAEKDGYLRNPFGYVHKFSRVYDYKHEFGEWVRKPGADANRVISFKPQSTAVGIITEAILRLFHERFEEAGKYLRLQVHDELLFECPKGYLSNLDKIVKEEMERPVPELRMPTSWGMGDCLEILTEEKMGDKWGIMI